MKALALVFTLTLGTLLSGPARAGEIASCLPSSGAYLSLPGPESLYAIFSADLPRALVAAGAAAAIQQKPPSSPPKDINLSINVNEEAKPRSWYLSPVWMAIGGLGLALLIILIVMAARGSGGATTVVRG